MNLAPKFLCELEERWCIILSMFLLVVGVEITHHHGQTVSYFQTPVTEHDHDLESLTNSGCGSPKQKNSSRRNAWGNQSYADLITQAIKSTPEQRLTLSQIYDWVVKNVPYFKDKGDSASSSGWKVISFLVLYR